MSSSDVATVAILGFIMFYTMLCAVFPFLRCRWCERGRWYNPFSFRERYKRAFMLCPFCGGKARRVRLGRKVYEILRGMEEEERLDR